MITKQQRAQAGVAVIVVIGILLALIMTFYHIAVNRGVIDAILIILGVVIGSIVGGVILTILLMICFYSICFILFLVIPGIPKIILKILKSSYRFFLR